MKEVREEVVEVKQLAVRFSTAAKVIECSESTIRKLVREGKLKAVLIGADRRILVASIKKFLRQVWFRDHRWRPKRPFHFGRAAS